MEYKEETLDIKLERAKSCARLIHMAASIVTVSVSTSNTEMTLKYANKLALLCDDLTDILDAYTN